MVGDSAGTSFERTITLSDGKLTLLRFHVHERDGRVFVDQIGERIDPDGEKLLVSEPMEFEDRSHFISWLIAFLSEAIEQYPYISIEPPARSRGPEAHDDYMFL